MIGIQYTTVIIILLIIYMISCIFVCILSTSIFFLSLQFPQPIIFFISPMHLKIIRIDKDIMESNILMIKSRILLLLLLLHLHYVDWYSIGMRAVDRRWLQLHRIELEKEIWRRRSFKKIFCDVSLFVNATMTFFHAQVSIKIYLQ